MSNNVSVTVNVRIGDRQEAIPYDRLQSHENFANAIVSRVSNSIHNPIDRAISALAHKVLRVGEVFLVKTRGYSSKIIKSLLLEVLPRVALKIVKIAPALLAIAI